MQDESKVIQLECEAIDSTINYLMREMPPDEVLPYLVERRLLSQEQAGTIGKKKHQRDKLSALLLALKEVECVGRLPTLCAALVNAGKPHVAEVLRKG